MNNINLNELRNRAYKTACEHGFHDKELSNEHCLCLIVGELMEAVEADRKGRLGKKCKSRFEMDYNRYPALVEEEKRFKCSFEKNIKDTPVSYTHLRAHETSRRTKRCGYTPA